jgi:ferredoxin
MEEYLPTLLKESWKKPQLRTIPVHKSIHNELPIMTYENAAYLVRDTKKSVVAPCICRREQKLLGKGCDKPEETCLVFDHAADYYQQNGLGREIDRQEVLDILNVAENAGLVLQPNNAKKIVNICCCCGDCCGVLRNLKTFPKPSSLISSPFFAKANPEICNGCGVCIDRCQMTAIQLINESASTDIDRCIGCGLCVSTCPTGSMALFRKAESDQPVVPQNNIQAAIELGRSRGKLTYRNLLMMQVKSKFDRLMALK